MKIKTLIVDDQPEMIKSLELFFQYHENIELVGRAMSGEECLNIVQDRSVDLILMDISMETETAGLETAQEILKKELNPPKIVFLTAFPERKNIKKALDMECSFVDKECSIPRVMQIVEDVFFRNKLIIEIQTG